MSETTVTTARPSSRVTQLDGLRGIAALVVLASHLALTVPGLAAAYANRDAVLTPLQYAIVYSPFHLLWNGTAAVYVFFVLSGFVLVLPLARAVKRTDWRRYYVKRLLRLYLPVWGSLVFAVILLLVVPHTSYDDQTWWTRAVTIKVDLAAVAHDALLLLGTGNTNSPLWSLRWEVAFSLLLPLYALFALRLRRLWAVKVVLLLVAITAGGFFAQEWLFYLPIFALGAIIAVEHDGVQRAVQRLPLPVTIIVALFAVFMLNAVWLAPAQLPGAGAYPTVGAALAVILFVAWRPAEWLGNLRISQWLGRVSFSLYLVHVPIVLAMAWLLRPVSPFLQIIVTIALALVAAELFYRLVERPSHLLAIAVGERRKRAPQETS